MENPQASWHGWFAPAGTPTAVVTTIYDAVQEALVQPKVRSAIEAGGYRVMTRETPAQFHRYVEEELRRLADVAQAARISVR
jgi:tripartite-type tricarboxylate transporter receptor subunit TctC